LRDAGISEVSDDRKFATAYNAALQVGKMAIACAGYRVVGEGAHRTTFAAISLAVGRSVSSHGAYFEVCRRKRNRVEYDSSGTISPREAEEVVFKARELRDVVEVWIDTNHPSLSRDSR